jgi:hypothetical protein
MVLQREHNLHVKVLQGQGNVTMDININNFKRTFIDENLNTQTITSKNSKKCASYLLKETS